MQTDRLTKSLLLVRPTGKKRADLHDKSSAFSVGLSPGMTGKSETRGFRMANGNKRITVYRFPVPKDLDLPADMFAWKQCSVKKSHNGERYVKTPVNDRYRTYHAYSRKEAEDMHRTFCLNWRNKQNGIDTEFVLDSRQNVPMGAKWQENRDKEESVIRMLAAKVGYTFKKYNRGHSANVLRLYLKKVGMSQFIHELGGELYLKIANSK